MAAAMAVCLPSTESHCMNISAPTTATVVLCVPHLHAAGMWMQIQQRQSQKGSCRLGNLQMCANIWPNLKCAPRADETQMDMPEPSAQQGYL